MAETSRGYPYPALSDAPAGPQQIQALAQALNTDITAVAGQRTVDALIMLGRSDGFGIDDNTATVITFYGEGQLAQTDPTDALTLPGSGKIQAEVDGVFEWSGTVAWDAMGSSGTQHRRSLYVWKNGSQPAHYNGRDDKPVPSGTWPAMIHSSSGRISLDAGDYLQAVLFQDCGHGVAFTSLIFSVALLVNS